MRKLKIYNITFNGALLKRGFWLYIWRIEHNKAKYFYIGRTGDNSSANASSPFRRMSMHFDSNSAANCIVKHLKQKKIDPLRCSYRLAAYGPIYLEQSCIKKHQIRRDKVAALEAELADSIKTLGFEVLGKHPQRRSFSKSQFNDIWKRFKIDLKL